MLGVLACYIMLQMALLEGMRKHEEQQQEELTNGEEGKPHKGIKSLWKKSA